MRDHIPEIRETGARLVLIGNGTPAQAKTYQAEIGSDIELLVDPKLVGYHAMDLKRSLLSTYNPTSFLKAIGLSRLGFRQRPREGDPLQLGGVFVISPEQRVTWAYRSRSPADFPAIEDILAAAGGSS